MSYSKKTDRNGEMITSAGLLYIEPQRPRSAEPVIDQLTVRVAIALDNYRETGTLRNSGTFVKGRAWNSVHTCSCGAKSTDVDYKLSNGMFTNSLAPHYMAWHRDEVPPDQLELVREKFPPAGKVNISIP